MLLSSHVLVYQPGRAPSFTFPKRKGWRSQHYQALPETGCSTRARTCKSRRQRLTLTRCQQVDTDMVARIAALETSQTATKDNVSKLQDANNTLLKVVEDKGLRYESKFEKQLEDFKASLAPIQQDLKNVQKNQNDLRVDVQKNQNDLTLIKNGGGVRGCCPHSGHCLVGSTAKTRQGRVCFCRFGSVCWSGMYRYVRVGGEPDCQQQDSTRTTTAFQHT